MCWSLGATSCGLSWANSSQGSFSIDKNNRFDWARRAQSCGTHTEDICYVLLLLSLIIYIEIYFDFATDTIK